MTITTETALAAAIKEAKGPLSIQGGGSRGFAPEGGVTLSTAGLSGITLYEPGALTLVAQAGTPLSEIERTLAAQNQRLAFEPMDHRVILGSQGTPTIGGAIAANVSGPRRLAVGAARDFLLGVRFVDGTGRIVKNGGRVMKNVTGYDLVKLMAGSYGTLGVLSEVALKVLPCPETEASLILTGLEDAGAVAAMARAMGSPFEVTGAAHDPAQGMTALRLEGFADSVAYRLDRLRALLADCGAELSDLDAAASATHWAGIRDLRPLTGGAGDIWRISCKPSAGPALAAAAGAEAHLMDWAGGLIWLRAAPGTDLRAQLGDFDGHATLIRAGADSLTQLGRFHPQSPAVARIGAGLRARFDPRGILNPGLMAGPVSS